MSATAVKREQQRGEGALPLLFNAQFGAGAQASALCAAFRLPDTLFSLISGGALSSAMIRVLLSTRREEEEGAAAQLTNLLLIARLAVIALTVLRGEFVAPVLTNTMQVFGRAIFMALLVGSLGVLAAPRAFARMATLEMVTLGLVLLAKVRRRIEDVAPRTTQR